MKRRTAAAITLAIALILVGGCGLTTTAATATTTAVTTTTTAATATTTAVTTTTEATNAPATPKSLIVNGTFDVREYVLSLLPAAKATFLPDCGELKQLLLVAKLPRGEAKVLVIGAVSFEGQVSPSIQIRLPKEGVSYNLTPSADTATIHGRCDHGDFFISEEVVGALMSVVPKLAGSSKGENPFEGTELEHTVDNTVSDYAPMVS